jgi:hypothetical protein
MTKIYTETVTLPACWASALINGDYSCLDDDEERVVNDWSAAHPHYDGCFDCSDYPELAQYDGLLTDCLTYTFPVTFTQIRGELEYLIYPAHLHTDMLPWQTAGRQYTATGYGSKIPTTQVIYLAGRKYRVYCRIYSNIGTCYIMFQGRQVIVP